MLLAQSPMFHRIRCLICECEHERIGCYIICTKKWAVQCCKPCTAHMWCIRSLIIWDASRGIGLYHRTPESPLGCRSKVWIKISILGLTRRLAIIRIQQVAQYILILTPTIMKIITFCPKLVWVQVMGSEFWVLSAKFMSTYLVDREMYGFSPEVMGYCKYGFDYSKGRWRKNILINAHHMIFGCVLCVCVLYASTVTGSFEIPYYFSSDSSSHHSLPPKEALARFRPTFLDGCRKLLQLWLATGAFCCILSWVGELTCGLGY